MRLTLGPNEETAILKEFEEAYLGEIMEKSERFGHRLVYSERQVEHPFAFGYLIEHINQFNGHGISFTNRVW